MICQGRSARTRWRRDSQLCLCARKRPNGSASPLSDARGLSPPLVGEQAGGQAPCTTRLDMLPPQWGDGSRAPGCWDAGSAASSSCVVPGKPLSVSEALSQHLSEADNTPFLLQALRGLRGIRYVKVLCN